MRVLVIGATGRTGRIAVRRLLERGAEVTAFVRKPEGLPQEHERLRLAVGNARDARSLEAAVADQNAVLSALGPRAVLRHSDLQEVFMRNLVSAMEKTGVKQLSNLSAAGVGGSYPAASWWAKLVFSTIARSHMADKARGEAILFASSLDYVNVRPGVLRDGPPRGRVQALASGFLPFINREDLAAFMIDQLTDDRWLRQSVVVGY